MREIVRMYLGMHGRQFKLRSVRVQRQSGRMIVKEFPEQMRGAGRRLKVTKSNVELRRSHRQLARCSRRFGGSGAVCVFEIACARVTVALCMRCR